MEIKKEVVKKLITEYWERQDKLRKSEIGKYGKFYIAQTDKGKLIYSVLKNREGWFAVVCFYDSNEFLVDIYDKHVFTRYQDRFLKDTRISLDDVIQKFIRRGNISGTYIIEPNNVFSKRIVDGACFGSISEDEKIIYNKTYYSEDMLKANQQDYLLRL